MNRPTWDEYFLQLAKSIASRSTCDRGRSGCIIVRNKRILCTGYVGSPTGMSHCDEVGHLLRKVKDEKGVVRQHCMRTTHAEQNALIQAARSGIAVEGGTLYCTMEPCRVCAMLIVGAGIKQVICEKRYHASDDTREIFAKCSVDLKVIKNEIEEYDDM